LRSIRVDEEVWSELQKHAQGFEDTPNEALRRIFNLSSKEAESPMVSRLRGDDITTERDYNIPILASLVSLGGRARTEEVLQNVGQRMRGKLKPADLVSVPSGETRWRNAARWARNTMVKKTNPPLLNPSAPNGWWEITQAGRDYLRQTTGNQETGGN
jgi:hypothetical protein